MSIGDIIAKVDLYLLIPVGIVMLFFDFRERHKEREEQRIGNQEINVVFQNDKSGERRKLQGTLLRKDCTRGEVFGLISMNSIRGGRLTIEHMKTQQYFEGLKRVQEDTTACSIDLVLTEVELSEFPFSSWELAE